jgi:hypothetical protein
MTPTTHEAEALAHKIRRLLEGRGPEVQGAVLADLVSIFFASHHPALRAECVELWIRHMRELIPISEKQIFPNGKPQGWETQ